VGGGEKGGREEKWRTKKGMSKGTHHLNDLNEIIAQCGVDSSYFVNTNTGMYFETLCVEMERK
jgi:hypothetical protein